MTTIRIKGGAVKRTFAGIKILITGSVLTVCIAAGTAGVWFSALPAEAESHSTQAPAVPVQTAIARSQDVPVYLDGLGVVQAFYTIDIKTRVDGELQSVNFTEGQHVKKGDLLAVIDPRPYQAALDEAAAKIQQDEASLENAQYLLQKDQKLATQQIATAEEVEAQESQVNQLTAQLAEDKAAKESAEISLSYTQIRSPIDGRTGIRLIDAGNQVHTADTTGIVVVTQTQPISVISTLREEDLGAVRSAMSKGPVEVTALTSDRSTKLSTGTLSLIDNEIDQSNGTIRIKSTFENTDNALWPGQFVTLQVRENLISNAVTVPSAALQRGPHGFFVYVVESNGTVAVRKVTPGATKDGEAVIADGIKAGEKVVIQGQYRLDAGTRVSDQTVPTATATKEQ